MPGKLNSNYNFFKKNINVIFSEIHSEFHCHSIQWTFRQVVYHDLNHARMVI